MIGIWCFLNFCNLTEMRFGTITMLISSPCLFQFADISNGYVFKRSKCFWVLWILKLKSCNLQFFLWVCNDFLVPSLFCSFFPLSIHWTYCSWCFSDWNPHADLQAMARAHRLGQTNKVKVYAQDAIDNYCCCCCCLVACLLFAYTEVLFWCCR